MGYVLVTNPLNPPHRRQAMLDACSDERIRHDIDALSLRDFDEIRQIIFEDADLRLAGEEGFLHKFWPHLRKLNLARDSAKSSMPKSKLAPKKRTLSQIKSAMPNFPVRHGPLRHLIASKKVQYSTRTTMAENCSS